MSNPSITADKTPWYQWDTGLTVTVSGGEMNECHFANRKQGTAYVQAVINGVARVPDELLHVEDAWPGKPIGLTIEGACKQDGTPSPDNPVPITVIENPVLKVTGRNLIVRPYTSKNGTSEGVMYTENVDGSVTASGTSTGISTFTLSSNLYIKAGTYTLSADVPAGCGIVFVFRKLNISGSVTSTKRSEKMTIESDDVCNIYFYVNKGITVNATFYPQLELGVIATVYSPYVNETLPITLPAEHPYLAALPDGTHDEIVIDKDGNVSLVAMVCKTETAATDGVNATVGTDALSSTGAVEDGATVYYKLATPVTYNLGKLDMPALPETISNVWTDAELVTNMSMKYKRDINVAFENIVQAVVAAAAGE